MGNIPPDYVRTSLAAAEIQESYVNFSASRNPNETITPSELTSIINGNPTGYIRQETARMLSEESTRNFTIGRLLRNMQIDMKYDIPKIRSARQALDMTSLGSETLDDKLREIEYRVNYYQMLESYEQVYNLLRSKGVIRYKGTNIPIDKFGINPQNDSLLRPGFKRDINDAYDRLLMALRVAKTFLRKEGTNYDKIYDRFGQILTSYDKHLDDLIEDEMMRQRESALELDDIAEIIKPAKLTDAEQPKFRQPGYVREETLKESYSLAKRYLFAAQKLKESTAINYDDSELVKLNELLKTVDIVRAELPAKVYAGLRKKYDEEALLERATNKAVMALNTHLDVLVEGIKDKQSEIEGYNHLKAVRDTFKDMVLKNHDMRGELELSEYAKHYQRHEIIGTNHADTIRQHMLKVINIANNGMQSIAVNKSCKTYKDNLSRIIQLESEVDKHLRLLKMQECARGIYMSSGASREYSLMRHNILCEEKELHEVQDQRREVRHKEPSRMRKKGIGQKVIEFIKGERKKKRIGNRCFLLLPGYHANAA